MDYLFSVARPDVNLHFIFLVLQHHINQEEHGAQTHPISSTIYSNTVSLLASFSSAFIMNKQRYQFTVTNP